MAQASSNMLPEAIAAARAGDRTRARELLSRLLRADSANAEYWVWMSAVVESQRERIYCLESALNADPTNRAALRGLVVLGARKPAETKREKAKVPQRRVVPVSQTRSGPRLQFSWLMLGGAVVGIILLTALGSVVIALLRFPLGAVVAPTLPPPTATLTPTPNIPTATITPIPAETRAFRTPVPTELVGTPIAFFVEATPTPTPVLGLTPHPNFEAYGAGIAAMQRGDYESAAEFMRQVIELNPDLVDAYYFQGEALRLSDLPGQAILLYDRASLVNNSFAPTYLGRGRARLDFARRQNPVLKASDLPPDFDSAIERDPQLAAAYLEKANFYAGLRLWKTMEETLQAAIDAGVREPIVYIKLSQAQFNRNRFEQSLESALEGSADDGTILEGYKAIGRAQVALEQYDQAIWPLQTYVAYEPDDHTGWGYLGRAYFEIGDLDNALEATNRSLEINDRYAPAYLTSALIKMARGDYEGALVALQKSRQFGAANYRLTLAFGEVYYKLADYFEALDYANEIISEAENPGRKGDGYQLRALIYEATNPPLLDEARLNWQWILDTEGTYPETKELANVHLAALDGVGPTLTPTPDLSSPTTTPTPEAAEPTPTP
ncbi:MAG: tetratricopeptide repeat protein [Anaerolineales bacterium]